MRISIQGQNGSFHEMAARQHFGDNCEVIPARTFRDAFQAVANKQADALVIAIENSLYGSINDVYDLVETYGYPIIGEVHLPIHHMLIGHEGTHLADITHVYSQAPALGQCAEYLERVLPGAELVEHYDTAESVAFIKQLGSNFNAAIASSAAARLHGMSILAANIEDHPENYTRFLVLQPEAAIPDNADRSSLVLTTSHEPGALASILTLFADAGINLSKLQSRPIVGEPWHYKFYLVVETAGSELHAVLEAIRKSGHDVTVLGEYVSTVAVSDD